MRKNSRLVWEVFLETLRFFRWNPLVAIPGLFLHHSEWVRQEYERFKAEEDQDKEEQDGTDDTS